jgi:hypothetical protein
MIQDSDDQQLRALFHEELASDASNAPDFATLWTAAALRHRTRFRVVRMLPFAAALLVSATLAMVIHPRVKSPPREAIQRHAIKSGDLPWRSTILLTEWRAPSDEILPTELQP